MQSVQITESLRPILMVRPFHIEKLPDGSDEIVMKVVNEGAGVALDVWWMYGKPGRDPDERHHVQDGLIPSKIDRYFRVSGPRAVNEGVLVVCESLAGITSGTGIEWNMGDATLTYYAEIDDWAKNLLGRVLRPTAGDRPKQTHWLHNQRKLETSGTRGTGTWNLGTGTRAQTRRSLGFSSASPQTLPSLAAPREPRLGNRQLQSKWGTGAILVPQKSQHLATF